MYWDMQASKIQNSRLGRVLIWCIGVLFYVAVKLFGKENNR